MEVVNGKPSKPDRVESEPRLNPKRRAIRTGLFSIDEITGRKLAVYMCSAEQNGELHRQVGTGVEWRE